MNTAIAGLADNPRPLGVKKLVARGGYRIRAGDYRVLYVIDDEVKVVAVYRVMPRGSAYRP